MGKKRFYFLAGRAAGVALLAAGLSCAVLGPRAVVEAVHRAMSRVSLAASGAIEGQSLRRQARDLEADQQQLAMAQAHRRDAARRLNDLRAARDARGGELGRIRDMLRQLGPVLSQAAGQEVVMVADRRYARAAVELRNQELLSHRFAVAHEFKRLDELVRRQERDLAEIDGRLLTVAREAELRRHDLYLRIADSDDRRSQQETRRLLESLDR